jgi:hypothetical protein
VHNLCRHARRNAENQAKTCLFADEKLLGWLTRAAKPKKMRASFDKSNGGSETRQFAGFRRAAIGHRIRHAGP